MLINSFKPNQAGTVPLAKGGGSVAGGGLRHEICMRKELKLWKEK